MLQEVLSVDEYNFEGSSLDEQRIYGLHFDGILSAAVGSDRMATTASGCFEHSSDTDFISVTKNACFNCEGSTVSNAGGANATDICPSDNAADIVQLQNSLGLSAGSNYVYLLTDENQNLQEVIEADQYNFEGSQDRKSYGLKAEGSQDRSSIGLKAEGSRDDRSSYILEAEAAHIITEPTPADDADDEYDRMETRSRNYPLGLPRQMSTGIFDFPRRNNLFINCITWLKLLYSLMETKIIYSFTKFQVNE